MTKIYHLYWEWIRSCNILHSENCHNIKNVIVLQKNIYNLLLQVYTFSHNGRTTSHLNELRNFHQHQCHYPYHKICKAARQQHGQKSGQQALSGCQVKSCTQLARHATLFSFCSFEAVDPDPDPPIRNAQSPSPILRTPIPSSHSQSPFHSRSCSCSRLQTPIESGAGGCSNSGQTTQPGSTLETNQNAFCKY